MDFFHPPVPRPPVVRACVVAFAVCLAVTAGLAHAAPYQLQGGRARDLVSAAGERLVVIPGSVRGPHADGARLLSGRDLGLRDGDGTAFELRARVIRSGDVNGDGQDDLVVGVEARRDPYDSAVAVVPGSTTGLRPERAYFLRANDGWPEVGESLLVSDLDGDGFADVVTNYLHEEDRPPVPLMGSRFTNRAVIFWGSSRGVRDWQGTPVALPPEHTEYPMLGSGDVTGDGRRDLVIVSAGFEGDADSGVEESPGGAVVCEVSKARDISCGESVPLPGGLTALAVGDFVGDRRADVVTGKPYDDYSDAEPFGGALYELRSSPEGFAPVRVIDQDSTGVPGRQRNRDGFGYSVAVADVDRDGKADLGVGIPGKRPGGRVVVLFGHRTGLGYNVDRVVSQDMAGVPGVAEPGDDFGHAISLLDVDSSGVADLVVTAPGEDADLGAVTAIAMSRTGRPAPGRFVVVIQPADVGIRSSQPAFGYQLGR